jgi:hypothetical protein
VTGETAPSRKALTGIFLVALAVLVLTIAHHLATRAADELG